MSTGRRVRVTFNYRYSPPRTQIKDILMSGAIGDVLSVDFHWLLNTHHGADYFRRWHREKKNSGGLMVHKATHHFDLVNWWLGAMPVQVMATGKREFYTPTMARRSCSSICVRAWLNWVRYSLMRSVDTAAWSFRELGGQGLALPIIVAKPEKGRATVTPSPPPGAAASRSRRRGIATAPSRRDCARGGPPCRG